MAKRKVMVVCAGGCCTSINRPDSLAETNNKLRTWPLMASIWQASPSVLALLAKL